jgi:hypothetical protein
MMMLEYITYFLAGLGGTWVLLFFWGFTAGPVTPSPYYSLLASLVIWLGASILSLYFPKPAALLAMTCGSVSIIAGVLFESWRMVLSPFDLAPIAVAVWVLTRLRRDPWFAVRPWQRSWVRVLLSVVPIVTCYFVINARAVAFLLLQGPPR